MRRAFRCALLLSIVVATAGCPAPQDPAIVINETGAPIHVRYSSSFFTVDVGTTPICPLLNEPPEVKAHGGDLLSPGWMPAAGLKLDAEKCEASFTLEPGFASRLLRDNYCDDYEKHADQGAAWRPWFEYLVIESRGRAHEWRQWEAVAQFKRTWGSHGCFFVVST